MIPHITPYDPPVRVEISGAGMPMIPHITPYDPPWIPLMIPRIPDRSPYPPIQV